MALEASAARRLMARAVDCLTRREYSREELRRKLLTLPEVEAADVDAALDLLKQRGYLSDERYAEGRVRMRAPRYGNRRLAMELRQKGVSAENIQNALQEAGDELSRAQAIWQKKFGVAPADMKEKARQFRFLAARGFSFDVISRVVSAHGAIEEDFEE